MSNRPQQRSAFPRSTEPRDRPNILVIQDWFLPGCKAGGAVRTLTNIIEHLGGEYRFAVLTRDRDRGDRKPYTDIRPGWIRCEGFPIKYLTPWQINPWGVRRAQRDVPYDLVYFNSFFSRITIWFLVARRLGLVPRRPVLLAPRGEFPANTLALKRWRKALYIWVARRMGLCDEITWHASSESERDDVLRFFDAPVEVAVDLPARPPDRASIPALPAKLPGAARFVFLSRLVPKKNLATAIELIGMIDGDVIFDIYGTAEDRGYLAHCERQIRELPPNVKCRYLGSVPYEAVHATLAGYHFFFLPTLNENFGHVILEALVAGLPLLISDQTFWRDLERQGVGYDVDLADPNRFIDRLNRYVRMGPDEFQRMSAAAISLAAAFLEDPRPLEANRRLFRRALGIEEQPLRAFPE